MDNIGRIFLKDISDRLSSHIVYRHELIEQISQKQLSHEQLSLFITQYIYLWKAVDEIYKDFFKQLMMLKEFDLKALRFCECMFTTNPLIELLQEKYYKPDIRVNMATLDHIEKITEICTSAEDWDNYSNTTRLTSLIIINESFNLWLFTRADFEYLFNNSEKVKLFKDILDRRILNLSQILEETMKISNEPKRLHNSYFVTLTLLEYLELFLNSIWNEFNLVDGVHTKKVGTWVPLNLRFDIHQSPFHRPNSIKEVSITN